MNTILIIEDDESYRSLLLYTLESEGYKVFVAAGGIQAKDILKEITPDIVITDIFMEDMDGIEVIMHLKNQHPDIKIIAISGGGRGDPNSYLESAKGLGADCTIMKPFSNDEITSAVKELIN